MIKHAAYKAPGGKITCAEIEVRETAKMYILTGTATWATSYATHIKKDGGLLFDTKREALQALCLKLERKWETCCDAMQAARDAWASCCQQLEES